MHWAAHGHTAAEIIYKRANADKRHMGLTSWSGKSVRKSDTEVAKNYLDAEELGILNRLVSMYLDFAELQALNRSPMYMKDWITKLDDFLQVATTRDILSHTGKISHRNALDKAREEYQKYREQLKSDNVSLVEKYFLKTVNEIEKINQDC